MVQQVCHGSGFSFQSKMMQQVHHRSGFSLKQMMHHDHLNSFSLENLNKNRVNWFHEACLEWGRRCACMHSQERSNMIECITRQEITQHFCTEYENPEPCSTFVSKQICGRSGWWWLSQILHKEKAADHGVLIYWRKQTQSMGELAVLMIESDFQRESWGSTVAPWRCWL